MSRFRNLRNWNEFRWESEIRRDERRINRYFTELASCIDLPGEEEIIAGLLSDNADLIPTAAGNSSEGLRGWSYLAPHDEDSGEEEYSSHRPEQAVINLLDSMACQWNAAWVCGAIEDLTAPGLSISCSYGKLLARMADFADADESCDRGLKITLGKRTLADINELADALKYVSISIESLRPLAFSHLENLAQIHDRVITVLKNARKDEHK